MGRKRALDANQRAQVGASWLAGESTSKLAIEFGVHRNTVSNILQESGLSKSNRNLRMQATPEEQAETVAAYLAIDAGDLGDSLNAGKWLFLAMLITAKRVAGDKNYPGTPAQRRADLAAVSAVANKLLPIAKLHKAREMIRKDAEEREKDAAPQMVKVGKPKPKRKRKRRTNTSKENYR